MIRALALFGSAATALLLAASGAVAASATTPAPAPSVPADIYIAVYGNLGSTTTNFDPYDARSTDWGASLTGEYNITPVLGVQGDLRYDHLASGVDVLGSILDQDLQGTTHAFYRNDLLLVGLFGELGTRSLSENSLSTSNTVDAHYTLGGAEAQVFLGNATLYAQGGFDRISFAASGMNDLFGTVEARYFLTPNLKIDVQGSVERVTEDILPTDVITVLDASVGAEYRIDNTRLSFTAAYDHMRLTDSLSPEAIDSDRIMVGAKFSFDSPTLLDRDRHGASLKPFDSQALEALTSVF